MVLVYAGHTLKNSGVFRSILLSRSHARAVDTVHVDGKAVRSCSTPLSAGEGAAVTTIEGLSPDSGHPLQKAWVAEQVPQCGYCQSGQIMQAAALLARIPNPTREQIVTHMDGNICRCGTYTRIVAAIQRASREG